MWEVTSSRIAYENRWISVVEDQVVRPDGQPGVYGVVAVQHEAVFIVAANDVDEVLLERVDRHTVGPSWEVPAGANDGEDLLVAARRELYEETGYEASQWRLVGSMNALNGICRAPEHVFLAQGVTRAGDAPDAEAEGISDVAWVAWSEVVAMIADGRLTDGETVASLMYAAIALGKVV